MRVKIHIKHCSRTKSNIATAILQATIFVYLMRTGWHPLSETLRLLSGAYRYDEPTDIRSWWMQGYGDRSLQQLKGASSRVSWSCLKFFIIILYDIVDSKYPSSLILYSVDNDQLWVYRNLCAYFWAYLIGSGRQVLFYCKKRLNRFILLLVCCYGYLQNSC